MMDTRYSPYFKGIGTGEGGKFTSDGRLYQPVFHSLGTGRIRIREPQLWEVRNTGGRQAGRLVAYQSSTKSSAISQIFGFGSASLCFIMLLDAIVRRLGTNCAHFSGF